MYGKELILDLYGCNIKKFHRKSIELWLDRLCKAIDMQREDLHFWDYEDDPEAKAIAPTHLNGISAVQFITTSNIVIHTLDVVAECYVNIFTCKEFDCNAAAYLTKDWFEAQKTTTVIIVRGSFSQCKTSIIEDSCFKCVSHGKCSGPQMIRQPCSAFREE